MKRGGHFNMSAPFFNFLTMKYLTSLSLIFILVLTSCTEETSNAPVALPSSLLIEIDVTDDGSGVVNASATAIMVNYFTFEFFDAEGNSLETIQSSEGEASYMYSESGDYRVLVKAHASFEYFIEKEETFSVEVGDDLPPIGFIPTTGYDTPMSYPGYDLVWSDEFDGNSLSADWTHEIGTGSNGWGNNELQYYRPENTEVRDGYLIIQAKEENYMGRNYTSSRIITEGAQSFQYGRIDIRAALPWGKGLWPALWMLGESHNTIGWPACGEIDIMELVGGGTDDSYVHGTVHWDNNGTKADYGCSNRLTDGIFAEEWHVFSLVWDESTITWYRDDIQYCTIDITPAHLDEFREPFFFIFNVAVGGNWPGSPNADTQFPQHMVVDYVRVFQEQ